MMARLNMPEFFYHASLKTVVDIILLDADIKGNKPDANAKRMTYGGGW
jgi:hypothetical protein